MNPGSTQETPQMLWKGFVLDKGQNSSCLFATSATRKKRRCSTFQAYVPPFLGSRDTQVITTASVSPEGVQEPDPNPLDKVSIPNLLN